MENVKLSVKTWVCDSGIYCELTNEFIGNPLNSTSEAVVILKWLNKLDEKDIKKLFMNYIKVKRERESEFATRITTKLKGC
jgi:hypothetical protein